MRLCARLVSAALVGLASAKSSILLLGLLAVVMAVLVIVIGPAVWSKNEERRDAALAVLDCLFRYRR
jgi:hypothetical protein